MTTTDEDTVLEEMLEPVARCFTPEVARQIAALRADPTLALQGPDDANNRGVWIPTISLDQYGATLASWFGVGAASLPGVFPSLGNFAVKNIGFLG